MLRRYRRACATASASASGTGTAIRETALETIPMTQSISYLGKAAVASAVVMP